MIKIGLFDIQIKAILYTLKNIKIFKIKIIKITLFIAN